MKTLFTIPVIASMIVAGLLSFRLFQHDHFALSALLTLTSFLSVTLFIYLLETRRMIVQ